MVSWEINQLTLTHHANSEEDPHHGWRGEDRHGLRGPEERHIMTTIIMVSEKKISNVPVADMDDEKKIHIVLEAQMNIQAGKKIAVPAKEKQHGYSVPKNALKKLGDVFLRVRKSGTLLAKLFLADSPLQDALLVLYPLQELDRPAPAGRGRQVALVALTLRHASRESI